MPEEKIDVVLVLHPILGSISTEETEAALPAAWNRRDCITILPAAFDVGEQGRADWYHLASLQAEQWAAHVEPVLRRFPRACVAYFGLAPIPLAVHLGSLLNGLRSVVAFQKHHTSKRWSYDDCTDGVVKVPSMPVGRSRSSEPVMISLAVSATPDVDSFLEFLGPTSAKLEVSVVPTGNDNLKLSGVREVARRFNQALRWVEADRQEVQEIHLLSPIPCGVAFSIGAELSPTRDPTTVTYFYDKDASPRFREALRLPVSATRPREVPSSDLPIAETVRGIWEKGRARFCEALIAERARHWPEFASEGDALVVWPWNRLPRASGTAIERSICSVGNELPEFRLTGVGWEFGAGLLLLLRRRFPADLDLERAGRLLMLHEALHPDVQGLRAGVARNVRVAARVVEELDYQADVWAIVHEFWFSAGNAVEWPQQRLLLLAILDIAISTMWAFDEGRPVGSLETRRIARYLVWYVVRHRIDQARSLNEAMHALSEKPIVELGGLRVRLEDGRMVADLRAALPQNEFVHVGVDGRIRRRGATGSVSPGELAVALGRRDQERARDLVAQLLEHE